MEPDGRTYLLPFPLVARLIMAAAGLFALVIAPYELWRGVWPLNITTPFFGFIMFGGMSVGAAFAWAGLSGPSGVLRFSPGLIEIELRRPWGVTHRTVRREDMTAFVVEERENSEGPNDWCAIIRTKSGQPVTSRPLQSREAAEKQLEEFRRALD